MWIVQIFHLFKKVWALRSDVEWALSFYFSFYLINPVSRRHRQKAKLDAQEKKNERDVMEKIKKEESEQIQTFKVNDPVKRLVSDPNLFEFIYGTVVEIFPETSALGNRTGTANVLESDGVKRKTSFSNLYHDEPVFSVGQILKVKVGVFDEFELAHRRSNNIPTMMQGTVRKITRAQVGGYYYDIGNAQIGIAIFKEDELESI